MYKIRAAQIDLNRQKETMDFIKSYVDFIANNGYNTLVLYIAWRVKLASHPYPSKEEAYTADEIREIVSYATHRGLGIIPATNLTFVNSLLRYDKMKKYLEDGTRFGTPRGNFCLSNPEIYTFIENYLRELAALVPSDYFHIGGDEAWDTGFCKRCKGDDFNFQKEQNLYLNFILKCCDIVKNKLCRRVIIWDDMFEYYSDSLEKVPRDVILGHWQYQRDGYRSMNHYGNRKRGRRPDKYDAMGFDYLIAPASYSTSNGRTVSDFWGNGKNCLGGIMTVWVTHLKFMYKDLPTIGTIGRYWKNGGEKNELTCFRDAICSTLGTDDEILLDTIRAYTEKPYRAFNMLLNENNLMNFAFNGLDYPYCAECKQALRIIKDGLNKTRQELGRNILEEISFCYEIEIATFELKEALRDVIYGCQRQDIDIVLKKSVDRISFLADAYSAKWEQWRSGIVPNNIRNEFSEIMSSLQRIVDGVLKGDFIKVLFCLPNCYGGMRTKVSIDTGQGEKLVADGLFKGFPASNVFFERVFFPDSESVPTAVRIETSGYGGQGVSYVAMEIAGKTYVPQKVLTKIGRVENPDSILDDDCKFCWLGEVDVDKAWQNRKIAEDISAIKIVMTEQVIENL